MGDLSPHFSRWEFASHDGVAGDPVAELVQALERLRALVGRPLHIISGYRSPAWNRYVGGALYSQHLLNTAADIPAGYATLAQAQDAGFRGIGLRGKWAVHVDVRAVPAVWRY